MACGGPTTLDGGITLDANTEVPDADVRDAGAFDAGSVDAGVADAGAPDAGAHDAGLEVQVRIQASLFWSDAGFIDDPSVVSFERLLQLASNGDGGQLLHDWFLRFSTTEHSERALPAQFIDEVMRAQGPDPARWTLSQLPFIVTAVHNRIDLARDGHCGELRVSVASLDLTLQPFHMLFLFKQPAASDDRRGAVVTCEGTARRWAALSLLTNDALELAVKTRLAEVLIPANFDQIETLEQSLSPWEWRQWRGLENPPLFQQVDVERLNRASPARNDFLRWVETNAEAIEARTAELPDAFRPKSIRGASGVARARVSLSGVDAGVLSQFPRLLQHLELMGCAVCHTADADFVQTRADRSISPFYAKELEARARNLEQLVRGEARPAPFGPLQPMPVLP